jgi:lipopolysaccharide/colanic/teichoic acid biosynthesis glycosyltransferase
MLTPAAIRFTASNVLRPRERRKGDKARRLVNILVASIGIVITSPLMLIIAVLVKATSRGPVIYRQPRVGIDRRLHSGSVTPVYNPTFRRECDLGGKIFMIYKFRTMRTSESEAPQVWAAENDPRITPVGRVLRSFRLDELPQLFNVLKGDMNIVGPRPEQPAIFQDLRNSVGRYRVRQRVLPGITGLAQVTLPYDQSLDDVKNKVDLDLQYIRRRSAGEDLMIMAKTMPVMVFRRGAV